MSRLRQLSLLVAVIAPFMCAWTYFAAQGLPAPIGDSFAFYPIAAEFAATGDLRHPFYSPIAAGGGPLVWHGWVAMEVVGAIARELPLAAFPAVLVAESMVMWLSCLVAAACLAGHDRLSIRSKVAVMLAFCGTLWSSTGRPDVAAQPLLVVAIFIVARPLPLRAKGTLLGVVLGLLAASQPTVAVIAATMLCAVLPALYGARQTTAAALIMAAVSAGTLLATTAVAYSYSVDAWLAGLVEHARVIAARKDAGRLIYYYFLQPRQPLVGAWLLVGGAAVAFALGTRMLKPRAPILFAGAAALFVIVAWYFGIRVPATSYNLVAFVPGAAIATALVASRSPATPRRVLGFALAGLAMVTAAGMLLLALIMFESKAQGVDLPEMEMEVRQRLHQGAPIAVHPTIAAAVPLLAGNPLVIVSEAPGRAEQFLTIQAGSGALRAPAYQGLFLVRNCFRATPISVAGMKLANTPRTYEFAAYSRGAPDPGSPGAPCPY